MNWGIILDWFN